MTYDALKAENARKPFTILELIFDINDPALDATFALQLDSYGTPRTTDNAAAYTGTDFRTYRYADQQIYGIDHFVGLGAVKSNNPKIDPGRSIGLRATSSASIKDFISNDIYELRPPYDDRRVEGSHFLKLLARNYYKNRRARIIRGYGPDLYDASNVVIESYIIDSIAFPDENSNVKINLIDELILTEDKKAKGPIVSSGELAASITSAQSTLTYTTPIPFEYGAAASTGYIVIEKEIIAYTVTDATSMGPIVRGQFGTTAAAHDTAETMQECVFFDDENIIDIITTLITDYTNIPTSYIPTTDWAALKAGDLADYNLSRVLWKPEEIKKMMNELISLAGLSMYVDVVENEIVIVTIPDFATPVITFDEKTHLSRGTIKIKEIPSRQITRQRAVWGKVSATETDDEKNYSKDFQVIDGVVEANANENNTSEPKALKTNWLDNNLDDNQLAINYTQRQVNRWAQMPITSQFRVDDRWIGTVSGGNMWLGTIFEMNTARIVGGGLNNIVTTFQCTSLSKDERSGEWNVTGLSYVASIPPNADLYIDADQTDYLLTDDLTTTEAREYVVVINSGITIDSSATSVVAFDQGSFFAGATLSLVILGRIVGAGGAGGTGTTASPSGVGCTLGTPGNGLPGGDALNITTDATIDNGFGLIAGGGGGGAGLSGLCLFAPDIARGGDGGGGGQGQVGGGGGAGGNGTDVNGDAGQFGTIAAEGSNGGAFGDDGDDNGAGTGGAAGAAIQENGNAVTITAGNNSEQIKGDVVA